MNIKKFSTLLVVLTLSLAAMAQNKLYFCDDVSEAGAPIGHSTSKAVIYPDEGGYVYALYSNNKKPIKDKELNVKVELKNDKGAYQTVQNVVVEPEVGKTWFTFDLQLPKVGEYKITVQTMAKQDLISETLKATEVEEEVEADE